ncbi:MAG TPA: phosphatidylserine decarboxylase family protein [Gemmatimonadaceae bacterium]|nr:phosphatidylserine decarboxylase family protein [Gemmatimonadaceae bacterium]
MNFAREGLVFIGIAFAITAGVFALALTRRSWPIWLAAFACTILALWVAYFFRDPERRGERGESLVVSPADGRVVMITEVDEPTFVQGKTMRVSIFMNVFNVHVNRYPVSGTVKHVARNPGKFFNAALEKASLENEQTSVGIETSRHRILVRQIAGLIARRIANYAQVGAQATQGERMGIIRFGSRVDVFVPAGSKLRVKVGDVTSAGTTVLAELPT